MNIRKAVLRRGQTGQSLVETVLMLPLLLIVGGGYYWFASGGKVSTDDAAIKQDIVSISAQVNGPITQVAVRNGQHVKQGDLLFTISSLWTAAHYKIPLLIVAYATQAGRTVADRPIR